MEIITSKVNPNVILALKLKQKKYRDKFKKVLLEGRKIIQEAVNLKIKIFQVFTTEENFDIANKFNANKVLVVSPQICKALSSTVTSQNIFAIAEIKENSLSYRDKVLILDGLQNPDNLGTIIRSAVATNFLDIFAINSVDIFNEKTIRSSMGNVFKVNLIKTDYQNLKTLLKDYQILTADMNGENVFNIKKFNKKVALCIGNEGNGVSEQILNLTNKVVSIPMQNNVESLNASVSAGIIMYQILNRQGE